MSHETVASCLRTGVLFSSSDTGAQVDTGDSSEGGRSDQEMSMTGRERRCEGVAVDLDVDLDVVARR